MTENKITSNFDLVELIENRLILAGISIVGIGAVGLITTCGFENPIECLGTVAANDVTNIILNIFDSEEELKDDVQLLTSKLTCSNVIGKIWSYTPLGLLIDDCDRYRRAIYYIKADVPSILIRLPQVTPFTEINENAWRWSVKLLGGKYNGDTKIADEFPAKQPALYGKKIKYDNGNIFLI